MTIRTRVAPSPTGDPHVGTAYIALFNLCFARQRGGQFILRIEDTDRTRSSRASEDVILHSLRWLGLEWDEGPDKGGPYGPYRQSERGALYNEYAEKLLEGGFAFRCFCTPERLEEMRQRQRVSGEAAGYDGKCLSLTEEDSNRLASEGKSFVVRLNVPRSGSCVIEDFVRGSIEVEWQSVDMQVLLKSDGMPTYHLANVVDDHLMQITHVIRGEDWISSAPKHLLLYKYFGWQPPALCHLPLLRNPDRSKLSKRKNPTSMLWYERMGYLPEALLNYLGTIASPIPGSGEIVSLSEMMAKLDLGNLSLGGPVFDVQKLTWLNGRWIREALDDNAFADRVEQWALNRTYLMRVASLARPRTSRLSDLGPMTAFLFSGSIEITQEELFKTDLPEDVLRRSFQLSLWRFDALPKWERPAIERVIRDLAKQMGFSLKAFIRPFYVAITGSSVSLPLFDVMELLGRDISRDRIRNALKLAGGVSALEREAWKSEEVSASASLES